MDDSSAIVRTLLIFNFIIAAVSHGFPSGVEKRTHIRFYFQDIVSGENPTAIRVVDSPATQKKYLSLFGAVNVADDPMTETPNTSSKLLGRMQGIYTSADQRDLAFLMLFNMEFVAGEFNGSSLTLVGKNQVFKKVREMPIVGGTGVFRMARGYALAKSCNVNFTTGDATVEYNVYVVHY